MKIENKTPARAASDLMGAYMSVKNARPTSALAAATVYADQHATFTRAQRRAAIEALTWHRAMCAGCPDDAALDAYAEGARMRIEGDRPAPLSEYDLARLLRLIDDSTPLAAFTAPLRADLDRLIAAGIVRLIAWTDRHTYPATVIY